MNTYDRFAARARCWAMFGASLVLLGLAHAALSIWGMTNECAPLAVYGAGATVLMVGSSFAVFERAGHWRARATRTLKHLPLTWRKL